MNLTKLDKNLIDNMSIIFSTEEGMHVLKHLQELYVDASVLQDDVHKTMYALGQKEFVLFLISLLKDKSRYDDIELPLDPNE